MPDSTFDYEQAIEACAKRDEQALQRLYKRESPRMLALLISLLGHRDLAEDCLHDAFVQIWQNAGRYQRQLGSGRAWLYSIARYRALNELRRRSRWAGTDEGAVDSLIDDTPGISEQLEQHADNRRLVSCLSKVDDDRRRPILLAFYRGLTHAQISSRLSIPLGTIKGRIRAGLRALQECLQA